MSAPSKGPFRFTALPRELQVEIAEYLPMKALKKLSLTTKQIREHITVVLFKEITTPEDGEPVILSTACLLAVQNIHFKLYIQNAGSRHAGRRLQWFNAQSVMLPLLVHLRIARLDILTDYDVQLETLQMPLAMVESAIKAFTAICGSAKLEASLVAESKSNETGVTIVGTLFNALSCGTFSFISLEPFSPEYDGLAGSGPIYKAFQSIASHLQSLELDASWAGLLGSAASMPHLRDLRISAASGIVDNHEARTLLATVSSLLKACGSSLRTFELDADLHCDITVITRGLDELARIHPKRLDRVKLAGNSFTKLHGLLRTLRCCTLAVAVTADSTWRELQTFISTTSDPPESIHIEIGKHRKVNGWQRKYAILRQAARTIGVVLTIEVQVNIRIASVLDLHEGLRDLAPDLLMANFSLPNAAFDPIPVYAANSGICLTQCSYIGIFMREDLETKFLGSPSLMSSALMRYIEAPRCQTLYLDFASPLSDYLPSLIDAISRNVLPALGTIEGSFVEVDDFDSEGEDEVPPRARWQSGVGAVRKAALEQICLKRGISLDNLFWD